MTRIDAVVAVAVATLWLGIVGTVWGTGVAGGSDPYGYVSQAGLWTRGGPVVAHPMAAALPWPDVDATLAPLGYRPGPTPGTIVPVYPAGLPLVMAAFQLVAGPGAVFWVVPLLGMLAVVATAAAAGRLAGPTAAAAAALLLAASPTLAFAATWPMSDAAVTGWWALVLCTVTGTRLASAGVAGAAAALAVMTRPNLVTVAIAPGLYLAARAWRSRRRADRGRLALFAGLTALGCLGVAAIHTVLYGAPFATGYGDLGAYFELSRRPYNPTGFPIRPLVNASDFVTRSFDVEPALVLAGAVGAVTTLARRDLRAPAGLCLGLVGLVLASYLFFRSFPEWWYLRLLLPAYPAWALLGGLGVAWIADKVGQPLRVALLAYLALVVTVTGVRASIQRDIFSARDNEARFAEVGRFAADALPPTAVLLARQQSGSLRYYADRLTVRFDVLHGDWLERATLALHELGYTPYYVIEEPETALFNQRFAGTSRLGALNWPPIAEFGGPTPVRIYDPADHPAFTERLGR